MHKPKYKRLSRLQTGLRLHKRQEMFVSFENEVIIINEHAEDAERTASHIASYGYRPKPKMSGQREV